MTLSINQKANQLAKQFRQDEGSELEGGVVIIFKDQAGGWMNELRDPQSWEPGCIAVDINGKQWVATGGNAYDGAKHWEAVPTSNDETLTCPNCKTGFRSNCSIRTNAGQVVCSDQCAETLNANNDLPLEAHHPKGSLCMNCQKAEDGDDCSHLPFNTYRVIDQDRTNNIKYVRCEQFERN